jgi:NADPH:quinone reductase-like Zn-dependent oxidoreductase
VKAAVCERYGPPEVVRIREMPDPVPGDHEVLVKVYATTVNSGDARVRALRVPRGMKPMVRLRFGLRRPKQPVLGLEAAGRVEAVGAAVTGFRPGDRVVASREFEFGCHAEYVTVAEDGVIARIPDGLGYPDAVSFLFGGVTTHYFFRRGKVAAGESVLVNGASGAVGAAAVQLARHLGAEVTAVCSGANADLVRRLGAAHVIDYTTDDFTSDGRRYDVIMDNHGNAHYARVKGSLAPGGRFLLVYGNLPQMIAASWRKAVISGTEGDTAMARQSFETLMSLAGEGAIEPVIDTVLPFEQIADAYRRVDGGHKVGSVVLTLADGD